MNAKIDTIRDCFKKFLSEGMTHSEALAEFDEEEFKEAMNEEILSGEAARCLDLETLEVTTASGKVALLDLLVIAHRERAFDHDNPDMIQALELTDAGWECITRPSDKPPVSIWSIPTPMSWQWRRPSRRKGKPGRKFLSTNQAWRQLQRDNTPAIQ